VGQAQSRREVGPRFLMRVQHANLAAHVAAKVVPAAGTWHVMSNVAAVVLRTRAEKAYGHLNGIVWCLRGSKSAV
jgi:hypothetical protein